MRRNKRCLLAYHRVRAARVEGWGWEGRDVDTHGQQGHEDEQERGQRQEQAQNTTSAAQAQEGQSASANLSPEEREYFRTYTDFLAAYKGQFTDVDLTGSLEPPRDLFIDVRVLKDAGEIQTEYGTINLTRNSQYFVRQGDVERLIAQGFLQRLR
jgi:GINS complex subunit 1